MSPTAATTAVSIEPADFADLANDDTIPAPPTEELAPVTSAMPYVVKAHPFAAPSGTRDVLVKHFPGGRCEWLSDDETAMYGYIRSLEAAVVAGLSLEPTVRAPYTAELRPYGREPIINHRLTKVVDGEIGNDALLDTDEIAVWRYAEHLRTQVEKMAAPAPAKVTVAEKTEVAQQAPGGPSEPVREIAADHIRTAPAEDEDTAPDGTANTGASRPLNARQLKFAELYTATGNATQSYIDAGYQTTRPAAEANGARLLKDQRIQQLLQAAPQAVGAPD